LKPRRARVAIELSGDLLAAVDRQADWAGVTRQDLIKLRLADAFEYTRRDVAGTTTLDVIGTTGGKTTTAKPKVTSLKALPSLLTLTEIANLYRVSVGTIRRGLQNGTFRPQPWGHYPYRWTRQEVAADLKRRRKHTRRAHGFAAKRRTVKRT
jgi:hypothetical protein